MQDRKLATRYARALLSVLRDPQQSESASQFLTSLGNALEQSDEFRALMLDPSFPASERTAALHALARRAAQPQAVLNFLSTLVDNGRCGALTSIAESFAEEREQELGIVPAELVTASPMTPELQSRASSALEKMTGKRVRLTCTVEPSLLGGAVTRIGSMVYDGSLRTQLIQLRRKMAQE